MSDTYDAPGAPREPIPPLQRIRELEAENQRLRSDYSALKIDRDQLHKSICWLMDKDLKLDDEQEWQRAIEEAQRNPCDLSDLIRELENQPCSGNEEKRDAG